MGWIPEKMRTAAQGIRVSVVLAVLAGAVAAAPVRAYAPALDVSLDPSAAATPTALSLTVTESEPTRSVTLTVPPGFTMALGGASCSPDQEAARACPDVSRVGIATAATSMGGLSGNVYFGGGSKLILLLTDGAPLFPKVATYDGSAQGGQVAFDGLNATGLTVRFAGAPRALLETPTQCGPQTFTAHLVSMSGAQADARSVVNVDGCVENPPQISDIVVKPRTARAGRQATVFFTLSEDAAVEVRMRRIGHGRPKVVGRLEGRRGANTIPVGTRGVRPGAYLLELQATDPAGLQRTKSTRLRVTKRR